MHNDYKSMFDFPTFTIDRKVHIVISGTLTLCNKNYYKTIRFSEKRFSERMNLKHLTWKKFLNKNYCQKCFEKAEFISTALRENKNGSLPKGDDLK